MSNNTSDMLDIIAAAQAEHLTKVANRDDDSGSSFGSKAIMTALGTGVGVGAANAYQSASDKNSVQQIRDLRSSKNRAIAKAKATVKPMPNKPVKYTPSTMDKIKDKVHSMVAPKSFEAKSSARNAQFKADSARYAGGVKLHRASSEKANEIIKDTRTAVKNQVGDIKKGMYKGTEKATSGKIKGGAVGALAGLGLLSMYSSGQQKHANVYLNKIASTPVDSHGLTIEVAGKAHPAYDYLTKTGPNKSGLEAGKRTAVVTGTGAAALGAAMGGGSVKSRLKRALIQGGSVGSVTGAASGLYERSHAKAVGKDLHAQALATQRRRQDLGAQIVKKASAASRSMAAISDVMKHEYARTSGKALPDTRDFKGPRVPSGNANPKNRDPNKYLRVLDNVVYAGGSD